MEYPAAIALTLEFSQEVIFKGVFWKNKKTF